MESLVFFILALLLLGGAMGIIGFRQSINSAMSFLVVMLAMAGMYALLHQSFLFLAQILAGVGAVVVLSLLIILSINLKEENLPKQAITPKKIAFVVGMVAPIVILLFYAIGKTDLNFTPVSDEFGGIKLVGNELFSHWVLPFEVISILLLSAMVGAIVLSHRRLDSES